MLVLFFGMGIWALYSGCRDYLFLQKVKNTPTSKVSSAAVGLVELVGHAAIDIPLISPVSQTRCVYWRITGEYDYEIYGWKMFYSDESASHFHIRDNTGDMDVDPREAKIDIAADRSWEGFMKEDLGFLPTYFPAGPVLPNPAKRYILSLKGCEAIKFGQYSHLKIRITEYFIAEKDPLYVLGTAIPHERTTGPVNHKTLVIKKGGQDPTMYISDKTEMEVADRHISWAYSKIFLGLASSTLCLLGILMMFEGTRDILFLFGITVLILSLSFVYDRWKGHL